MITYKWDAFKDDKWIDGGMRRVSCDELIEYEGTCNILKLIERWNRIAQLQFKMNSPRILWVYNVV